MSDIAIALLALVAIFGGAVIGMIAAGLLPAHHLAQDTRNVVSVSVAVVGTMSALVMGLLISNASASFSAQSNEVRQISADVVQLNRTLERYGQDAQDTRKMLQLFAGVKAQQLAAGSPITAETRTTMLRKMEDFQDHILALAPSGDRQGWLKAEALQLATSIVGARWLLSQQERGSIPTPFLLLVACWLSIVFCSFGLFAPRNATATATLLLCSISVSLGLLFILEMDTPFTGIVRVSLTPLLEALQEVQR